MSGKPNYPFIIAVALAENLFLAAVGFVALMAMSSWFSDSNFQAPFNDIRVLSGTALLVASAIDFSLVYAKNILYRRLKVGERAQRYLLWWNGSIIVLTLLPTLLVFVYAVLTGNKP